MSEVLTLAAALDKHSAALNNHAAALLAAGGEAAEPKTRKARAAAEPAATPTTAATAAAPAAQAPAAATAAAAPAAASAASAATSGGPTLQQVADAIIKVANTVSREAAVKILSDFGASKVPQIKAADFPAVLAAAKSACEAPSAAAGLM